jgi:hypothetical protein
MKKKGRDVRAIRAMLDRTYGDEAGHVDAVFRALPVVVLPGHSRSLVRVQDYRELIERCR